MVTRGRAEGGPSVGVDYEYRFSEEIGAGAFAEYLAGQIEVGVFGAMVDFHPAERVVLGIGPGFQTSSDGTDLLLRGGGYYEFEAGEVTIAPAAYYDWIEGGHHAFMFGLNFGKKF